jgi:hypothetical protein
MDWTDILKRGMPTQYANIIDEIMSDGKGRSIRQLMGDVIEYKNHPDYLTAKRIKHRSRAYLPTRKEFSVHMQVMTSRGKYERVVNPTTGRNYTPFVYRKVEEEE